MKTMILLIVVVFTTNIAEAQGLASLDNSYADYDIGYFEDNIPSYLNGKKTKLFCITTSCCSGFGISIEIWSETVCHYVEVVEGQEKHTYTINFETDKLMNGKFEVKQPILLAGLFADNGNNLVLPKGNYEVIDNSLTFQPKSAEVDTYCYIKEVNGEIFGHSYHWSVRICISISFGSKGVVSIETGLTDAQLVELLRKGGKLSINNEINIQKDGLNFTLNPGEYIVNEDGKIYLQNIEVK